mmetsp:Transcript_29761/g.26318  ORF Transcript_29761/g.26318 Transcript_29761/m.26318 type:complete len:98 (-) Transcript_29761:160-453(-)
MPRKGSKKNSSLRASNGRSQRGISSRSTYVGATTNRTANRNRHAQNFGGNITYARTNNMRQAENRLLARTNGSNNRHQRSNAPAKPGWVYGITGYRK